MARQSRSLENHDQRRARLWPRHRRQQGPAQHQSRGLARRARDPRRQARLQRQIHHRDRRGDRLARPAAGVRSPPRGAEGGSVPGLRRAAAFGRPADHFPRLPRRQPHPSRCQFARGRKPFGQLGRRARQSRDDPLQRHREPRRRQGADEARRAQAAADLERRPRGARGREDRADRRRAGAGGRLGRGGTIAGRAAVCLEYAGSAGDVVGQCREAGQRHSRPRQCRAAASLRRRHQI